MVSYCFNLWRSLTVTSGLVSSFLSFPTFTSFSPHSLLNSSRADNSLLIRYVILQLPLIVSHKLELTEHSFEL